LDLQLNFSIITLLVFSTFSCGLKTRPKSPAKTNLPSIQDSYSVKYQEKIDTKKENPKKNKK
jgi:hypothetical protein